MPIFSCCLTCLRTQGKPPPKNRQGFSISSEAPKKRTWKRRGTHSQKQGFSVSSEPRKIPGQEGENTQKDKEILERPKSKENPIWVFCRCPKRCKTSSHEIKLSQGVLTCMCVFSGHQGVSNIERGKAKLGREDSVRKPVWGGVLWYVFPSPKFSTPFFL